MEPVLAFLGQRCAAAPLHVDARLAAYEALSQRVTGQGSTRGLAEGTRFTLT